jgi:hypothetical protein
MNPLQVPQQGPLWRELPVYTSFRFLIKIPLNEEISSLLSKALGKERPLRVPQNQGPYGNRCPFPETYPAYLSGSPVKDPSLQVPLIELPRRERPCF